LVTDALSPLLFKFALEYAIRKVHESHVELKFNGTHQLLFYADDVNLQGDNIDPIKKSTETLIDASNEVGLEVNAETTKCMLLARHQNVGKNHDMKIANRCFENVAQLRYFGTAVTNQNLIHEEIKGRLNSGNSCYCSVLNLLYSRLLSRNIKFRIYKTRILLVVLYGRETWSLTLRKEHIMRVSENSVLRIIFGSKGDEVTGSWRKLHNEKFHNLYSWTSIIIMVKSRRMRWTGHVARIGEKRNAYRILVGKPEGKLPLERSRRRWVGNIKVGLREIGWGGMDWVDVGQDMEQWRALVNTEMNLWVT
jgi:hypothetical protein